jgi:aldose 1-epimerase
MTVSTRVYGQTPGGAPVQAHLVTGPNAGSPTLEVLEIGAAVRTLEVLDCTDQRTNVVLGYAELDGYLNGTAYFGAVVGRYANRIAGGTFQLNGRNYTVPANEGANSLHGGPAGFDRRVWSTVAVEDSSVTLGLVSEDGDQGFPGRLEATVTYAIDDDTVRIDYAAVSDQPTVVNLTNHSYFNLDGEDSPRIDDHQLTVDADAITPVDAGSIPAGDLLAVDGTPFDFRTPTTIGPRVRETHPQLRLTRGVDHNFVIRGTGLRRHALLTSSASGIQLEILSDEPGIQVYTGNFLDGSIVGTGGRTYRQGAGIALETQHFPDSPNRPEFPTTVLLPGETYRSTTIWSFSHVQ